MTLDTLSVWLRCPICCSDLEPSAPLTLACGKGHGFDVAKRGYVTLLSPRTRVHGDSPAMLDARQRFLDEGHYEPLLAALDDVLPRREDERILDAGCGTGHYLSRMLATRPAASALAADLSAQAVARAVRGSNGRIDGLVADLWAPLPLRNGVASTILNVFSPRNVAEYARVLEPGGSLVVVIPEPEHLSELRQRGLMLGLQEDKLSKLRAGLDDLFALDGERLVKHPLHLDAAAIGALVGMGPSSHHRDRVPGASGAEDAASGAEDAESGAPVTVTSAVRVLRFRLRETRSV